MKFTNGQFIIYPQYEIQNPQKVWQYKIHKKSVVLFTPFKVINDLGDEISNGMFTITVTSPVAGIIGIKIVHFDTIDNGPNFELNKEDHTVNIINEDQNIIFSTGDLSLEIPTNKALSFTFKHQNTVLTQSNFPSLALIKNKKNDQEYIREQLSLDIGEVVYGLGERFTSLIKNGQTVDIWNKDGGIRSDQAYKNVPFYLTNKGYGVFVNQTQNVSFEIATENVDKVQFSVNGESLEYFVCDGPTPKEVLQKYTNLTGKPALPPAWSFGLWLSTSSAVEYNEKQVKSIISGMKKYDIPLDVMHIDSGWQKRSQWCTLEWDQDNFPHSQKMLQEIHKKGIKVCLWINPYIAQRSPLFNEAKQKGYLIKKIDGQVWQWDRWQAGMGIIDLTNPAAVNWFQDKLNQLLVMGVDCFKVDFGERIPTKDVVFYDGSDPLKEHNFYAYQYNKAVFEITQKNKGEGQAVIFARSGTAGSQKFPLHWAGDPEATFKSMSNALRGGLSLALSGYSFWSHDIGGFTGKDSLELYIRWTQFGLLSSHSRYHADTEYRFPWLFGEKAIENTRKFVKLKISLMPYIYSMAVYAHKYGIPVLRPLFLEFYNDLNTLGLDKQYMLGNKLLIAPIFNDHGRVNYYLPKGTWFNLLTKQEYTSLNGSWIEEKYSDLSLPVMVRENSILITGSHKEIHADYNYLLSPQINIFNLAFNQPIQEKIFNSLGTDYGVVTAIKKDNQVVINTKGLKGISEVNLYDNHKNYHCSHNNNSCEDSIINL